MTYREARSTRPVSHGEGTIVASLVVAAVGTCWVAASIVTEDTDLLLATTQWQGAIGVLQQNRGLLTDATDDRTMVILNVDMLIDQCNCTVFVTWVLVIECFVAPRIKIGGNVDIITALCQYPGASTISEDDLLAHVVIRSHDTNGRIIKTVLRDRTVQNSDSEICAPVRSTRIEDCITGHAHVETCKERSHAIMLSLPIAHDEALKPEFVFEEVIQGVAVRASI